MGNWTSLWTHFVGIHQYILGIGMTLLGVNDGVPPFNKGEGVHFRNLEKLSWSEECPKLILGYTVLGESTVDIFCIFLFR